LADEEPGPLGLVNQAGVLARPADAGIAREGPLDNRAGVHVDPGLDARLERLDNRAKTFEFRAHDFMVVAPPGVPRNPGARWAVASSVLCPWSVVSRLLRGGAGRNLGLRRWRPRLRPYGLRQLTTDDTPPAFCAASPVERGVSRAGSRRPGSGLARSILPSWWESRTPHRSPEQKPFGSVGGSCASVGICPFLV